MKANLLKKIALAGSIFLSTNLLAQENIYEKYAPDKIEHIDYDSINFESASIKKMPKNIEDVLAYGWTNLERMKISISDSTLENIFKKYVNIENNYDKIIEIRSNYSKIDANKKEQKKLKRFDNNLLLKLNENADSMGVSINKMSIRESLNLVFYTTKEMLDYRSVDFTNVLINDIPYNAAPLDMQVESGFGDCNIYASLANQLFLNLKNKNKNLKNIHLGHSNYGKANYHDWNQIYFTDGDKIYISSVDLSLDKKKNKIDNSKNEYLSLDREENMIRFYYEFTGFYPRNKFNKMFLDSYYKTLNKINNDSISSDFILRNSIHFPKLKYMNFIDNSLRLNTNAIK